MLLLWNEIRQRAITFSRNWSSASRERAEAQTFWNEFFEVFGIRRRMVASFEEPVKNLKGDTEFIDLFWKGRLIAEHKSRGKDLSKAHTQAVGYIQSLINDNHADEAPRYILVSDFNRMALHDLEAVEPQQQTIAFDEDMESQKKTLTFDLADFPNHIRSFAFIAGYETRRIDPEDPANEKAVELLGNLHDRLEDGGYTGHDLQRFMVRVLFCLFADDTGIFEPDTFNLFIQNRTREDGSDLGPQLSHFFKILNTPPDKRQKNLDEDLRDLPYVNGELYGENLDFPEFTSVMRTALLLCCNFKWERISPAIFGSLFQSVMQPRERRQIGAHYTSERDILKLIRSLFLDDWRSEFEAIRRDKKKLEGFHRKLGDLKFLDPACGCGNFLVISYRELRRLELDVLQARFGQEISEGDLRAECRVNVGQMCGIEIEEWPVRIAEVALWLMDHQMNQELFARFSQIKASVPLTKSPHIRQANALRIDWNEVLPAKECSYVLGNPPFVGKQFLTTEQKQDMEAVFAKVKGAGVLDYVTAWYFRAAQYIRLGNDIRVAFVSTNSITQGEQVGVLWQELFRRFAVKIHFGHRTFPWESEAKGKAHVHVVIIGFGLSNNVRKRIYDYAHGQEHIAITEVRNISPYLIESGDVTVTSRSTPLCDVPKIIFGNMPNDDGNFLLTDSNKEAFVRADPAVAKFVRPFLSAKEYLHGELRWCIWLKDASAGELHNSKTLYNRVKMVREYRLSRSRKTTCKLAGTPALFGEIRQPKTNFVLIPRISSEKRHYIPLSYFTPRYIVGDSCLFVADASLYHFGVLSSAMHMAWVRQVCGRLKSDFRYSNKLVYNNFPWPPEATDKQKAKVEELAKNLLDMRKECGDGRMGFLPARGPETESSCLANLYNPVSMPVKLFKAHAALDRAVDACYRNQPFISERQRVEYLFALYEQLITPLVPRRTGKRKTQKAG